MDRPQIVEWAVPTELTPRLFEQLWALPATLLKIAVTDQPSGHRQRASVILTKHPAWHLSYQFKA